MSAMERMEDMRYMGRDIMSQQRQRQRRCCMNSNIQRKLVIGGSNNCPSSKQLAIVRKNMVADRVILGDLRDSTRRR